MKAGKRPRRCVYCGAVTDSTACTAHRDLLAFDPMYEAQARARFWTAVQLGNRQPVKGTGA